MARQTPSQTAPMPFLAFFGAITNSVSRLLAAQDRSAQVLRLQNLSDDELADIGLSRDMILRHVYRDTYYV